MLEEKELKNISGGGFGFFFGVGTFLALLAGFLDGFTRPFNCR